MAIHEFEGKRPRNRQASEALVTSRISRRTFLKLAGVAAVAGIGGKNVFSPPRSMAATASNDWLGLLVDYEIATRGNIVEVEGLRWTPLSRHGNGVS